MQSPHSDEDDEDYVVEHDPDFARLVAEDNEDLARTGSSGVAAKSRKRSAVGQAVADAKRRKRARQTAQNVEDAWSEMNAASSGVSSAAALPPFLSSSSSSSSSSSAPASAAPSSSSSSSASSKSQAKAKKKSSSSVVPTEKTSYAGLSVQGMLALAAKKNKKLAKKKKKSAKKTKSSQNAALLKRVLRGTPNGGTSKASFSGASTGKKNNKNKKSGASEAALLAARKALNATQKKTITEMVRFGNDIHEVERVVPGVASSSSSSSVSSSSSAAPNALETLVAGLDGPKSVSTMQKTSLEWDTFKSKQGIGDELERYTKNGYLAKQDFLGRVDLRQFEQEKSQREIVRRYEESTKGKSK